MKIFPGDKLFNLKATHGLPLEVALERIIVQEEMCVSWDKFIEEARRNHRWDFQTLEEITVALQDAFVKKEITQSIIEHVKLYMLKSPFNKPLIY